MGRPFAGVQLRVVDVDDGEELPRGEVGYLEALVPEVSTDWIRPTDLATIDEDGFITIVDRAKDMVLRGGENIYCAEVEAALFDHPAVKETAVFAVPDDRFGEVPGAAVVCKPGQSVSKEDLQAFARERIAGFKVPTHFWFLDEDLPRNANGKFLKRELKARLID